HIRAFSADSRGSVYQLLTIGPVENAHRGTSGPLPGQNRQRPAAAAAGLDFRTRVKAGPGSYFQVKPDGARIPRVAVTLP
ncbi:hypothetical protein, partial [Klebsiella michiganensis]|uniref:hypothetical protein n=1 Tax=Klebsiella michiganensis TaxID=1134687 RepID=UPI001954D88E